MAGVYSYPSGIVIPQKVYESLGQAQLTPVYRELPDGGAQYTFIGPALRGLEVQCLSHFAAPSKRYAKEYGLDVYDTIEDWDVLFDPRVPEQVARLEHHRRIPGWKEHFEPHRELILNHLRAVLDGQLPEYDALIPVVQIHKSREGKLGWGLRDLSRRNEDDLHAIDQPPYDRPKYLPVLGPLFVAAFSPEHMRRFGPRQQTNTIREGGYVGGYTQDMGTTQAFALTIAVADTLLETPLAQALLDHTGATRS